MTRSQLRDRVQADLEGLSLADRLCLALGERLDAVVWIADASWGTTGRIRQIR